MPTSPTGTCAPSSACAPTAVWSATATTAALPRPRSVVAPLIGRSPFDFIGNDFNPGLGAALYDVMGKHLDVPAYKLMGPKVRERVSVAAWTKPVPPETLRQEVQRAAARATR